MTTGGSGFAVQALDPGLFGVGEDMRIGFEASGVITNNPTGIAHYISKLISAISSEIEDNDALAVFYKLSRSGKRFNWRKPKNLNVKNYYKSY